MREALREGGCLCGALRYALCGAMIDAGCHCRLCQRASGAPAVAWLSLPATQLRWLKGEPRIYRSTASGERLFCAQCGTPLVFRLGADAKTVDVALTSLDQPAEIAPQYHIWCASPLPWLVIDDAPPRYADGGPDTHDMP